LNHKHLYTSLLLKLVDLVWNDGKKLTIDRNPSFINQTVIDLEIFG